MPLIYVIGCAGAGKSTIAGQLRAHGIDAHDEDDPVVGSAHHKHTGKPVRVPPIDQRSEQWFDDHHWRIYDTVLDQLQARAVNDRVVLCGNSLSPAEAVRAFDLVVYLDLDDETIRHRVASREGNDFGQTPGNLRRILENRARLDAEARAQEVVIVDATRPLAAVVDELMQAIVSIR